MCFRKAAKMLSKSKLPKEKKEKIIESFKAKIKGCKISSPKASSDVNTDDEAVVKSICDVKSPHSLYPSAHRSYEVRYEPHRGRYVVASEVSLRVKLDWALRKFLYF